ncbi:hypothetical protein H257_07632 [Aphanomyces astaci]|uniref:FYVE-type domain-containing protein n=1 Tax=Aphanomyces astaci TaxID=112090 RepID=W4GIN2_APHAT|nr:hypothetical protein H257_07632 [Aphanomyces astaci]ETV78803.1 hypothetical protein H257_07632 [Aphanomyces astaci]|eukprot:XP_009831522.1 hypothetical protein H257_07632 [Aphanomyces astaci]
MGIHCQGAGSMCNVKKMPMKASSLHHNVSCSRAFVDMHTLPLAPDYFNCPPLPTQEATRYAHLAYQHALHIVQASTVTNTRYHWNIDSDDADLKMYEGWDPFTPNTSTLHAGTTEFIGHLDEVAGYYRTHHVKGHGVVADTHTLYTIVDTPTASVRVKWLATKTSSLDGFVAKKRRDFCVLEVKYKLLSNVVVLCWSSIDMKCCPPIDGMLRARMFPSGVVCQDAARRGYLHLSAVAHIDVQGLVPPLVALRATKDMCRAFAGVELCLRQSRLSASAFLLARDLRPLDSRRDCFLCHRRFSPLRKKTNCLKCGEVVCTACNPSWSVLVNGHLTKRRACTLCSLASKPSKPVATPSIHRDDLVPSLGFRSSDATTIDRDDSMSRYSDSTMGYHT